MGVVVVLAAMPLELRAFARAAHLDRRSNTGTVGSHEVRASLMGVGMPAAREATNRALAASDVDRVVVVGIAGGIAPDLPIGHVVEPEVVVDGDAGVEYRPPAGGLGRLITFADFQTELELMADLRRQGYAAVDMETAAVAAVCEARGCRYLVFRAISDHATDGTIDPDIAALARPDGSSDLVGALRYVLRRPWRIPRLIRLGRDAQRAATAAARAAVADLQA